MVRYHLANSDRFDVLLTRDQIEAIENRDMIRARQSGVCFDTYMLCIDPDYPPSIQKL